MIMAFYCYFKAGRTNPGNPPPMNQQNVQQLARNSVCYLCNNWKPPRSFHCFICNKCVLKMDHHCPWISNCVGYHNFKYFTLMTLYVSLCGMLYAGELFYALLIDSSRVVKGLSYSLFCASSTLLLPTSLSLTGIVIQNIINSLVNVTTVERAKGVDECGLFKCCQQDFGSGEHNPYNLGWIYNIEKNMGRNGFLSWILPIPASKENGCEYRTIPLCDQFPIKVSEKPAQIKEIKIGNKPEDYLIDVCEKYKNIEDIMYDDLLFINKANNIKQ